MGLRTAAALVAVVASAGCTGDSETRPPDRTGDVSTKVADAEWRAVIEDWYVDGTFDDPHRCAAVRAALERLPTSGPDYSSVHEDMRRLERRAC